MGQEDIHLQGHAIEARVCAEDPERDFLPSAGALHLLQWPSAESIRVDAGFATGDEVPATYDSLLGKVIAWAPERDQAAEQLANALEHIYCAGVQTNERWLARVLRAPAFREVRHSIAFLGERGGDFAGPKQMGPGWLALAAAAAHQTERATAAVSDSPWALLDGFTPNLPARADYVLKWRGQEHSVSLTFTRGQLSAAVVDDGTPLPVADLSFSDVALAPAGDSQPGRPVVPARDSLATCPVAARMENTRLRARYFRDGVRLHLWAGGAHYELTLEDPRLKEFSASAAQGGLTTPLPGVVAAVAAKVGQTVRAGEVLMVIEAMKMEHSISAPYDGTVIAVHFARGDRVPEGSQLLELAPTAAP
jgi:3-methylcrotonyl-CoA carboxylase alpha subunit